MSNIIQLREPPSQPTPQIVHRVTFEIVPNDIVRELFYAAISAGWDADNENIIAANEHGTESLEELQRLVGKASQYTVPTPCDW